MRSPCGLSGATGALIYQIPAPLSGISFGCGAVLSDAATTKYHMAIGSPDADTGSTDAGTLYAYDGEEPTDSVLFYLDDDIVAAL